MLYGAAGVMAGTGLSLGTETIVAFGSCGQVNSAVFLTCQASVVISNWLLSRTLQFLVTKASAILCGTVEAIVFFGVIVSKVSAITTCLPNPPGFLIVHFSSLLALIVPTTTSSLICTHMVSPLVILIVLFHL